MASLPTSPVFPNALPTSIIISPALSAPIPIRNNSGPASAIATLKSSNRCLDTPNAFCISVDPSTKNLSIVSASVAAPIIFWRPSFNDVILGSTVCL